MRARRQRKGMPGTLSSGARRPHRLFRAARAAGIAPTESRRRNRTDGIAPARSHRRDRTGRPPGADSNGSSGCTSGPTASAYRTVPTPKSPPISQPAATTESSIAVRTERTLHPVRATIPVIRPSLGPVGPRCRRRPPPRSAPPRRARSRSARRAPSARAALPTSAEEIVVTAGAAQGLRLLLALLLRPGDRMIIEDPTWPLTLDAARALSARPVALPVENGWDVAAIRARPARVSRRRLAASGSRWRVARASASRAGTRAGSGSRSARRRHTSCRWSTGSPPPSWSPGRGPTTAATGTAPPSRGWCDRR
jgi:hypothetical protein